MIRRLLPLAALVVAAVAWSAPASAQSCTGRFVNPISDVCWECIFPISIGPISIGSVSGVAGHAQPVLADLLLRLPDPAHRPLAGGLGTRKAGRRDARALVLPQSRRPHHQPGPAGRARAHRSGRRRRRQGLGLARALLHVSAPVVDRRAARISAAWRAAGSISPGPRSSIRPGSTTSSPFCSTRKPRCSPTCRRRRHVPPTARLPPWACRSIRCSGAPAARAGCIR